MDESRLYYLSSAADAVSKLVEAASKLERNQTVVQHHTELAKLCVTLAKSICHEAAPDRPSDPHAGLRQP